MAPRNWIDTSGGTPRLQSGKAAIGVLATLVVGWWTGLLGFIDRTGGGVWGTLQAIRGFLADPSGVIPYLFRIATDTADLAAMTHANWLASLGLLGQLVAFTEGVVIILVTVYGGKYVIRTLVSAP